MGKRGPKPKPRARKQGQRVMVNLTPGELAALRAAAGDESLGGYARRVLVRHLERR